MLLRSNQSIEDWNTSEAKWMGYMFSGATSFNQPIGDWNVSSIVTMVGMFNEAESFNQAIGNWNTSTVTDMRWMFIRAFFIQSADWIVGCSKPIKYGRHVSGCKSV